MMSNDSRVLDVVIMMCHGDGSTFYQEVVRPLKH